jgi:hypothetical protein
MLFKDKLTKLQARLDAAVAQSAALTTERDEALEQLSRALGELNGAQAALEIGNVQLVDLADLLAAPAKAATALAAKQAALAAREASIDEEAARRSVDLAALQGVPVGGLPTPEGGPSDAPSTPAEARARYEAIGKEKGSTAARAFRKLYAGMFQAGSTRAAIGGKN